MQKTLCNECKFYLGGASCLAFDKIPEEIFTGQNDHEEPLEGQGNNFIFIHNDEPEEKVEELLKID